MENTIYISDNQLRFRHDKWGGLAWFSNNNIIKLSHQEVSLLELLNKPRRKKELLYHLFKENNLQFLLKNSLIKETTEKAVEISNYELNEIKHKVDFYRNQIVGKPLWTHIQPSVFCNQHCLHCYCNGNVTQHKMPLGIEYWYQIIDILYEFGIINIYVTGGENLIIDEFFKILERLVTKNIGTGISTNGMVVNNNIIHNLKNLGIEVIQVSVDGSCAQTHDFIRGKKGAFQRTISGLKRLSNEFAVIINTVISRYNISEIEGIIKLGVNLNIKKFKFFPVKLLGRARNLSLGININEWGKIPFDYYSKKYKVKIDYLKIDGSEKCSSAFAGFAIDQYGDIYPCIFGTSNSKLKIGNILRDNIENIWFKSKIFNDFRKMDNTQPCRRCEI